MSASTSHLPSLLANEAEGPHSPLLVVSSAAHSLSPLPVVSHYLARPQPAVLVSALYEPRKLGWRKGREGTIVDLRSWIEGFDGGERDGWGVAELEAEIWKSVQACASPPVVILDSPPTLASNLGSVSQLALLVGRLVARLSKLGAPALLLVPLPAPVAGQPAMLPLLTPTTLSPTLIHLHLLPPALVASIHASYALLPPTPRWYNILLSVTSRGEGDSADCAAGGRNDSAGVVVAVEKRGRKGRDGVARSVEGLRPRKDGHPGELAASRWEDIGSLSELKAPPTSQTTEKQQEPTPQSSFNLDLTPSQRSSRSTVPIPYAHEGEASPLPSDGEDAPTGRPGGGIFYEPDEGDDMDEDDPDEDLEF